MASENNGHRERLEKALDMTKELYKTLIMTSPDAVSATDLEGNFTFVSPGTLELHGFDSEDELLGKNAIMLIDPKDHDYVASNYEVVREKGVLRNIEYTLLKKDGTPFSAEINVSALRVPEGDMIGYIATIRDVTEKKELEEHLMHVQKMEDLGLLAGRLAHDFNNFLQIIRTYTEIILSSSECETFRDELNEILKSEQMAESLTQQLLAFGRKQELNLVTIDINKFIQDLRKTIISSISKDIQLELDLCNDVHKIKADSMQLNQAIINIVINARDAMAAHGKITIKTRNANFVDDSSDAKILDGEYVELSITDTGEGISDLIKGKIFQPFFTTKKQGTGLGLSSVYGNIKQNSGYILFDSEVNRGTTFRIYLPKIAS